MKNSRTERDHGTALIVALWVVIFLSLIVGFFAFDMHVEARITSYYRKRLKADHLARAGIERAKMLMVKSTDPKIKDDSYEQKEARWYMSARLLNSGGAVQDFVDEIDTGKASVSIVPEPALRDVNKLDPAGWEAVLEVAGVPENMWDELIAAVTDWKDQDELTTGSLGAESEYYESLDPPYKAKNGPVYSVDELLLVKGFTPEILHGGPPPDAGEDAEPMSGIADLLTTYGDTEGKINVNAAPFRVLMTLPGMDEVSAEDIISEREGVYEEDEEDHSFKDPADFRKRFPNLSQAVYGLITTASTTYRIVSTGDSHGVRRTISCVIQVKAGPAGKPGETTVLRWLEANE